MAPRSKKIRAPSEIFFGYRKSRECSPKIFDFRASGIPVHERVDFFDTLTAAAKTAAIFCIYKNSAVFE